MTLLLVKPPRPISETTLRGIKPLPSYCEKEPVALRALFEPGHVYPREEVAHLEERLGDKPFGVILHTRLRHTRFIADTEPPWAVYG